MFPALLFSHSFLFFYKCLTRVMICHGPSGSSLIGHIVDVGFGFQDVRAHCYCASLVRKLFIGHERARHF